MSASPQWKVFNAEGQYIASCKCVEDAACLVAFNGDGSTIRLGHSSAKIAWKEGAMRQPAAESYDYVVEICHEFQAKCWTEFYKKFPDLEVLP